MKEIEELMPRIFALHESSSLGVAKDGEKSPQGGFKIGGTSDPPALASIDQVLEESPAHTGGLLGNFRGACNLHFQDISLRLSLLPRFAIFIMFLLTALLLRLNFSVRS